MGLTKTYHKFNIAAPAATKSSKNYQPKTAKYQAIYIRRCFKIFIGKELCWSLFLMEFQVFSCSFIKKKTPTQVLSFQLLRTYFFYRTPPDDCLEEHKILLKMVPIAIPNDISKVYNQKGSVICFLRSIYGRFMEFITETYSKGISCSWIFSASWALQNA